MRTMSVARPFLLLKLSYFFSLLVFSFSYETTSKGTNKGSFTTTLIHQDSPLSLFHKPNSTTLEKFISSYEISVSRHNYLTSLVQNDNPQDIQSPLVPFNAGYLVKISIGTPPLDVLLLLDTGSSLIWTQCLPCTHCYPQSYPLFDPHRSSTYKSISCPSNLCEELNASSCNYEHKCVYSFAYADRSYTRGFLASDMFIVPSETGNPIPLANMIFGCGDDNGGIFYNTEAGILGLGAGPLSLVTQLGPELGWQFSYCFSPSNNVNNGGKFVFGRDNEVFNGSFTSMIANKNKFGSAYYYLTINDISVAGERLNIPNGTFERKSDGTGGVIIDSGVPYTMLNYIAFDLVIQTLIKVVTLDPVNGGGSDSAMLCYKGSKQDLETGNGIPDLKFHFSNLDFVLQPANYFVEKINGVLCLAMVSTNDLSIVGILAQQNKNVGYDLENQRLYISDAVC